MQHVIRKGQKLDLHIESIASGGQGFCKYGGMSIFVDRGVPGDYAEIELYDVRKDFAHARISRLIEHSAIRQEAECKLFKVCGGCQWQHIIYENQLELKADILRQTIKHIGGIDPQLVLPAVGAAYPYHYRNKVQYPVNSPRNSSRILAGYYKEGSHELVNIKHCPVQPELLDEVMEAAKVAAEHAGLSAYDEKTGNGLIRHFLARYSFSERKALLTVVLNVKPTMFDSFAGQLNRFADELSRSVPSVAGICANLNSSRGNRIMGSETRLLKGQDFLIEELKSKYPLSPDLLRLGIKFRLSPASFFQINSEQAVQLMDLVLEAVMEYARRECLQRVPLIIDAFAGVASLALWVSCMAERVIAVEEVVDAVNDSGKIMKLNSINNVETRLGAVEKIFPEFVQEELSPQIVILDPPRKGVDRDALFCVAELKPDRIIYVSCNPATLARDLKILAERGYTTKSIRPVDLFPQTHHIESVTILDRQQSSA